MQNLIFLAQSDTTAGFLSQNPQRINKLKGRGNQAILLEVDSLKTLKTFCRIPQRFKNQVRRSQKTTFIYPNQKAIRVIHQEEHLKFLQTIQWAYSSSANPTKADFNLDFAWQGADVMIQDKRGFFQSTPSKIYKINSQTIQRIR